MTLLTKVQNENINENLKKRFENQEIYVSKQTKDNEAFFFCVDRRLSS